jgi:hypothetical protein
MIINWPIKLKIYWWLSFSTTVRVMNRPACNIFIRPMFYIFSLSFDRIDRKFYLQMQWLLVGKIRSLKSIVTYCRPKMESTEKGNLPFLSGFLMMWIRARLVRSYLDLSFLSYSFINQMAFGLYFGKEKKERNINNRNLVFYVTMKNKINDWEIEKIITKKNEKFYLALKWPSYYQWY